jgi:hypothetical protein
MDRFCRLCAAVVVAIALVVVVLLIVLLRPTPPVPPDYAAIPVVTDTDWDAVQGSGWSYLQRTSDRPAGIGMDGTAPVSPADVLAIDFTGVNPDTEPGVFFHALPNVREVYAEWWMKVSANWTCGPAGCGKVAFIFPQSGGDTYVGIYCDSDPLGSCGETDLSPPSFIVGGQLQWDPYAGTPILANVARTPLERNRWYRMAWYLKWSSTPTTPDGIWRIWVDGRLQLERTDLTVAIGPGIEWQFAPTRQVPPPPNEYLWIDHTIVRGQ